MLNVYKKSNRLRIYEANLATKETTSIMKITHDTEADSTIGFIVAAKEQSVSRDMSSTESINPHLSKKYNVSYSAPYYF